MRTTTPTRRSPSSSQVESFERRILFAIDVSIGTGNPAQTVSFTDADGTVATIHAAGGAATVTFDGTGVASSTTGRAATVTGTNVTMTNLVITGTNPSVTVRTAGGDGRVSLGGLSAAGPVRTFSGRGVDFTGAATLSNGIGKLELSRAQAATITINRSGQARLQDASATILAVQDTTIASQQPFRLLRVGGWAAGIPGQPDSITTPRINVLQSGTDFNADVTLSGNGQVVGRPVLGNARVLGALALGAWNVAGKTSRVAAGSVGSNWSGTFGDVANFTTAGDLAGNITADSINVLNANTITNAEVTLNRPFAQGPRATALNRLNVRGAISNADIRTTANIGTVSAASITGSTIFAGVNGGGSNLPTAATDFANAATIRNVTIRNRGTTPAFVDTNIAASGLGRMNLGAVQVSNGGQPFGLAALAVQSLSAVRTDTGAPVRGARLTDPADGLDLVDFKVRIF